MPMPVFSLLIERHQEHLLEETGCQVGRDEALGMLVADLVGYERHRVRAVTKAALQEIDDRINGAPAHAPTPLIDAHAEEEIPS